MLYVMCASMFAIAGKEAVVQVLTIVRVKARRNMLCSSLLRRQRLVSSQVLRKTRTVLVVMNGPT